MKQALDRNSRELEEAGTSIRLLAFNLGLMANRVHVMNSNLVALATGIKLQNELQTQAGSALEEVRRQVAIATTPQPEVELVTHLATATCIRQRSSLSCRKHRRCFRR